MVVAENVVMNLDLRVCVCVHVAEALAAVVVAVTVVADVAVVAVAAVAAVAVVAGMIGVAVRRLRSG